MVKTLPLPDPILGGAGASSPSHWTYWEREALAYKSGLLPGGEHVVEHWARLVPWLLARAEEATGT